MDKNFLDNEIDKWWCKQFTGWKMKRSTNHEFVPSPAYCDENFSQCENGTTKIAFKLDIDWQVDTGEIDFDCHYIRSLAEYFYELGKTVNE